MKNSWVNKCYELTLITSKWGPKTFLCPQVVRLHVIVLYYEGGLFHFVGVFYEQMKWDFEQKSVSEVVFELGKTVSQGNYDQTKNKESLKFLPTYEK